MRPTVLAIFLCPQVPDHCVVTASNPRPLFSHGLSHHLPAPSVLGFICAPHRQGRVVSGPLPGKLVTSLEGLCLPHAYLLFLNLCAWSLLG